MKIFGVESYTDDNGHLTWEFMDIHLEVQYDSVHGRLSLWHVDDWGADEYVTEWDDVKCDAHLFQDILKKAFIFEANNKRDEARDLVSEADRLEKLCAT